MKTLLVILSLMAGSITIVAVETATAAEPQCPPPAAMGCSVPHPVGLGPGEGAPIGIHGVDVSNYQGYPDWAKAKSAGLKWVYDQAGDGLGYSDPNFYTNWRTERGLGIKHGAYLFLRPESATAQADKLAESIKQAGGHGENLLPPVIDAEVPGVYSLVCTIVHRLQTDLKAYYRVRHLPVIVYTSPGLWPGGTRCGKLWVADYGVSKPIPASSWSTWTAWQYSSLGSVPGIVGSVDMDQEYGVLHLIHKIHKESPRHKELGEDIHRHSCRHKVHPKRYTALCKRWLKEYSK